MTVEYDIYKKTMVEIRVPNTIYDLFEYEDQLDYTQTNIHYGMYRLNNLIEDMEDENWELEDEDKEFIYEVYKLCERMFKENALIEIHFINREY